MNTKKGKLLLILNIIQKNEILRGNVVYFEHAESGEVKKDIARIVALPGEKT